MIHFLVAYSIAVAAVTGMTDVESNPQAEVVIKSPGIESVTFHSKVLNKPKTFCVFLPKDYNHSKKNWPVMFLFHGRGRSERTLINDAITRKAFSKASFVTIFPAGDDGWYINSPVIKADRYNDYIEEVIATADKYYGLSHDPKLRGLSGWSMGGYGCVMFAENHPQQFTAVAPIIGLLDFPRNGLPAGQSYKVPVKRFGEDTAVWKKYNPINNVASLKNMSICIITGKYAFDFTMNQNFAAKLKESGIGYKWQELPGSHSLATVRQAIPIVIEFMNNNIARSSLP